MTPQISRQRRETAAFSGFIKAEEQLIFYKAGIHFLTPLFYFVARLFLYRRAPFQAVKERPADLKFRALLSFDRRGKRSGVSAYRFNNLHYQPLLAFGKPIQIDHLPVIQAGQVIGGNTIKQRQPD